MSPADRTESHEMQKALKTQGYCETMRVDAIPCDASEYPRQESNEAPPPNRDNPMRRQDVAAKTTRRNNGPAASGGAKSGAPADHFTCQDRDLQRLIDAWPTLPVPI